MPAAGGREALAAEVGALSHYELALPEPASPATAAASPATGVPSAPPERAGGRGPAIVAFEPDPVPQADAEAEALSSAPPESPPPPELAARFRRAAGRLDALPPPPRMWNDFTDAVRGWGWHARVAAAAAAREVAAQEAEIARRAAFYTAASAAALAALAEPDVDLAAERALLATAPFRPRPGEAPPWRDGAAVSAEAVV